MKGRLAASLLAALASAGAAGCAHRHAVYAAASASGTGADEDDLPAPPEAFRAAKEKVDPWRPAAPWEPRPDTHRLSASARCVAEAQRVKACGNPEGAWAMIRACAAAGHFTALRELLDGTWDDDLTNRQDAPALLLRLIAMRGGAVDDDLRLLHARRVPLFMLSEALRQPAVYRGRLVVTRARVVPPLIDTARSDGREVLLAERALRAETREVEIDPTYEIAEEVRRGGSVRPAHESRAVTQHRTKVRRFYNYEVDTGHRIVARLPAPDPFLDADDTFILLLRFEGVRPDGDGPPEAPQATIVDYARPSSLATF